MQVLQRLRDAVRRKRRDEWQGQRFLHHDNAPSHTSLVVQQFRVAENIPVIIQPPHSPDLAPSSLAVPTLKIGLKGTSFATMEGIKSNTTADLRKVTKEAFRWCFK
jgi:transposase